METDVLRENPVPMPLLPATNLTRTGPGSNEAFAMTGRRDRSNTQINLYYIYMYIERDVHFVLTEYTVPAIVRNSMKRNAGSLVLPVVTAGL